MSHPPSNSHAVQAAMSRLTFWQGELLSAEGNGDQIRMLEAARFIEEYVRLIAQMGGLNENRPTNA